MADLIERDKAKMAVRIGVLSAATIYGRTDEGMTARKEIERAIDELPSAQPEPMTISIDHELTQEEYKKLRKDMADAPIALIPSAQPERKTGRWIRSGSDLFPFECDQCAETNERTTPWCPHCGVKMEVEHETD